MPNLLLLSADPALRSILAEHLAPAGELHLLDNTDQLARAIEEHPAPLVILDGALGEALPASFADKRFALLLLAEGANLPAAPAFVNPGLYAALARPFRLQDVQQHVQILLKKLNNQNNNVVSLSADCLFYPQEKRLERVSDGHSLALTDIESRLIEYLLARRNMLVSREEMLENVWGYNDQVTTHTLETHIYRLRSKMQGLGDMGVEIATGEGGYRLLARV